MIDVATISAGKLKFQAVDGGSGAGYSSFTFQVKDDGGTAYGGADTDSTSNTMTINVSDAYRLSGIVYEDINGDSQLDDAVGVAGVTVYLYHDSDADGVISAGDSLYATTNTDVLGQYTFSSLLDDIYFVVIDSRTISSAATLNAGYTQTDIWADQTYGSAGAAHGAGFRLTAGALFGGRTADVSDDASSALTAQHVTRLAIAGADISNVDSAFSFNVVTGVGDGDDSVLQGRSVQGSFR